MQTLGDFELDERVARGGMAEVWSARHTRTGNRAAVKVAPPSDEAVASRWMQEITAVTRIHHPCTLEVLGFGTAGPGPLVEEGSLFYGMPWASGGSLEDHRPSSWPDVMAALQALLRGLAAAHICGVLHLDVKPANLLRVFGPDDVRLSDFGISLQTRSWDWKLAGTPAYLAPEQAAGEAGALGPWTDLYAVGGVAWHWTTGRTLFRGTPTEIAQAHLLTPPPAFEPRMAVPPGLEDLLRILLRKRAFDRAEMAADVLDALEQLQDPVLRPWVADDREPGAATWSFSGPLEPLEAPTDRTPEGGPLPPASPIPSWRALQYAPRWPEAPTPALALAHTEWTLVGRDDAIDQLWQALQQVRAGTPRVVLLSGPPGIGREQLVLTISTLASISGQAGGLYHQPGPSSPLDGLHELFAYPYNASHSTASALRARLLEEEEDVANVELLVQVLLDPQQVDEQVAIAALARHVGCLTRRRPLVVALTDLDASDLRAQFTAAVLSRRTPTLVVASVGDAGSWSPAVTSLARHDAAEVLELTPLADHQIATLLGRRLPLIPELMASLVTQAAGRPARAIALLQELVDRDQLVRTPTGWAPAAAATSDLSEPPWAPQVRAGMHLLWSGEVSHAREVFRRALTEAAVQGPWRPPEAWLGHVAAHVLEEHPVKALNRLCRPVLDANRPSVRALRHLVSAMAWAQLGDQAGARHHLEEAAPQLRGETPEELRGALDWLADPEHHQDTTLAARARALLDR